MNEEKKTADLGCMATPVTDESPTPSIWYS